MPVPSKYLLTLFIIVFVLVIFEGKIKVVVVVVVVVTSVLIIHDIMLNLIQYLLHFNAIWKL